MKIIGLAGPSTCGKSSIATLLAHQLKAPVICLDQQYILNTPRVIVDGYRTFEQPQMYNANAIMQAVIELQNQGSTTIQEPINKEYRTIAKSDYLILEGFVLFTYPQLFAHIDHPFYLDLSWPNIVNRRKARGRNDKSDESFFAIGEKEIQTYVLPQQNLSGVHTLDATKSLQTLTSQILSQIEKPN